MSDILPKRKTFRRHHVRGAVVFITATTRRREPFFRDATHARGAVDAVWRVQTDALARVIAFVVMPDHVHLLVRMLGDMRVSELMTRFKWNAGASIRERRGRGRVWEERFYDRTIRRDDELASAIQYIDWNPVRAGLCHEPSEYPYESACAHRHADARPWRTGTSNGARSGSRRVLGAFRVRAIIAALCGARSIPT